MFIDFNTISVWCNKFLRIKLGAVPSEHTGKDISKFNSRGISQEKTNKKDVLIALSLFWLSLFIFTCALEIKGIEYRDDEIFYFKSTQEMFSNRDFLSPTYFGENRFQKPILFYWLIIFFYKIFGVNWFAARFAGALSGSLTIVLTWLLARELFDRKLATLSSFILMTIPLFFRHAKNAVPDMPFNFFIVWAMYWTWKFVSVPAPVNKKYSAFLFIACGLGFMIKGFAAILIPGFVFIAYVILTKKYNLFKQVNVGLGICLLSAIILPWFLYMVKMHGFSYLQYMLVDETKYRILGASEGIGFLKGLRGLGEHSLFYLRVILSYFAPWSLFFFLGLPFVLIKRGQRGSFTLLKHRGVLFCFIWLGVVFLFFSSLYFTINHYLLILTTPFAILTSFFFLKESERGHRLENIIFFARKYLIMLMVAMGGLVSCFFFLFFLKVPGEYFIIFLFLCLFTLFLIHRRREPISAPFILSFFMLLTMTPSSFFLAKIGLGVDSTFEQFVKTIKKGLEPEVVIAVGSHDIHEKEVQAFFDRPVKKIASDDDPQTAVELANLFNSSAKVYCFILEKDFDKFIRGVYHNVDILAQGYILRKRFFLDAHFFIAILRFDQETVRRYLLEKLLLIGTRLHDRM